MTTRPFISFVSVGAFFTAVLLVLYGSDGISAILLIGCGSFVVAFNRSLSDALQNLSSSLFGPSSPLRIRPFSLILWGIGIAVFGVISLVYD